MTVAILYIRGKNRGFCAFCVLFWKAWYRIYSAYQQIFILLEEKLQHEQEVCLSLL